MMAPETPMRHLDLVEQRGAMSSVRATSVERARRSFTAQYRNASEGL
jgi:hypothetical protein